MIYPNPTKTLPYGVHDGAWTLILYIRRGVVLATAVLGRVARVDVVAALRTGVWWQTGAVGVDARRRVQEARAPLAAKARRRCAVHLHVVGVRDIVTHLDGWVALAARGRMDDDEDEESQTRRQVWEGVSEWGVSDRGGWSTYLWAREGNWRDTSGKFTKTKKGWL